MKNTTKRMMLFCALVAVLATGCGEPAFSQMKSSKPKWAMAVVAKPESQTQQKTVEDAASKLAFQQETAAVVNWTPPDATATAIQKMTLQQGMDLVLLDNPPSNLNAIAQQDAKIRFAVLGDTSTPTLPNVRHITLDRKKLMFLAGFLAAEANKQSSQPFSVLVDHPRAADDSDWQMILAGDHYAGRHDVPVQVPSTVITPATGTGAKQSSNHAGTAADKTGSGVNHAAKLQQPTTPAQLSGKSMVLLTDVSNQILPRVQSYGMELIQTDQSGKNSLLQPNVIAEPAPFLQAALEEESSLLASGKWQGQQVVTLPEKQIYNILDPKVFPDKQVGTLLEIVEEQLDAGTLKPDDYVADRGTNG